MKVKSRRNKAKRTNSVIVTDKVRLLNERQLVTGADWLKIDISGIQTRTLTQAEYPAAVSALRARMRSIGEQLIGRMLVTPDRAPVTRYGRY